MRDPLPTRALSCLSSRKHFPFYQASDERWKNSVRHNLSINPHFRKESKAPQGAGHLWVVMDNNNKVKNSWVRCASAASSLVTAPRLRFCSFESILTILPPSANQRLCTLAFQKEERIQNFLASQISAAEAAEASANLAAAEAAAQQAAQVAALSEARLAARTPTSPQRPPTPPSPVTTGAKSQSQLNTVGFGLVRHVVTVVTRRPSGQGGRGADGAGALFFLFQWWSERVSLERSAEEILSGVKREVGIEFLTPMDLDGDLDVDVMKLESKEEKGKYHHHHRRGASLSPGGCLVLPSPRLANGLKGSASGPCLSTGRFVLAKWCWDRAALVCIVVENRP